MKNEKDKARADARKLHEALARFGLTGGRPARERAVRIRPIEDLLVNGGATSSCPARERRQDSQPPVVKTALPIALPREALSGVALATAFAELDVLIGLEPVKKQVRAKAAQVQNCAARVRHGLPVPASSHHMVFTGNPGTGKTTVARIVARIFRELGMLEKGHVIEVDRADLVAEYVGQTEGKVREILDTARGGVLFVDEAYALVKDHSGADYGQDAINILLKAMEDERDRLVVIFAGYPAEMETFLSSNPGLRSRCKTVITFPDYAPDELFAIFDKLCRDYEFTLSSEAQVAAAKLFSALHAQRGKGFGNGRAVRNAFEMAWERQALRLAGQKRINKAALQEFEAADIPAASELKNA